jgi:predicted  nucleic acid-binding Zn-ribbon protein
MGYGNDTKFTIDIQLPIDEDAVEGVLEIIKFLTAQTEITMVHINEKKREKYEKNKKKTRADIISNLQNDIYYTEQRLEEYTDELKQYKQELETISADKTLDKIPEESTKCDCGLTYKKDGKTRHEKTKTHKTWLENNQGDESE